MGRILIFLLFTILGVLLNLDIYAANNTKTNEKLIKSSNLDPHQTNNKEIDFSDSELDSIDNNSRPNALAFGSFANLKHTTKSDNFSLNNISKFGTVTEALQLPFGYNLFNQSCLKKNHVHYINPNYTISIGDMINVEMWGAFQFAKQMTVDTQGNIFLPQIGPVKVQGVVNRQLNQLLSRELKKVFVNDVYIYGNLITAQPIQVYVAGFVKSPGLYEGLSSDSIIYYLCQAGGINDSEGSYREIKILRSRRIIKKIDLYDFMYRGNIDTVQLHEGDVILVEPKKNTVSVEGNVNSPYEFEIKDKNIQMSELIHYTTVSPSVTHVRIDSHKGRSPLIKYFPINDALKLQLEAGDHLVFLSDQYQHQVLVTVTGETESVHQYVLKKGSTLSDLIHKIKFNESADIDNIQIFRPSVARQQKLALDASLARLERQLLTVNKVTADGAKMHAEQAKLTSLFIDHASKVSFQGQIVLTDIKDADNIQLMNNDLVNVPRKDEVITIGGEVMNAISVECDFKKGYLDYIKDAGGFTEMANKKKILIIHQNGKSELANSNPRLNRKVSSGDHIIVLTKLPSENWEISKSITQIMYNIGIAARAAILL